MVLLPLPIRRIETVDKVKYAKKRQRRGRIVGRGASPGVIVANQRSSGGAIETVLALAYNPISIRPLLRSYNYQYP